VEPSRFIKEKGIPIAPCSWEGPQRSKVEFTQKQLIWYAGVEKNKRILPLSFQSQRHPTTYGERREGEASAGMKERAGESVLKSDKKKHEKKRRGLKSQPGKKLKKKNQKGRSEKRGEEWALTREELTLFFGEETDTV